MTLIRQKTLAQLADSLAAFMPSGKAFLAGKVEGTVLRAFFNGLAVELGRAEQKLEQIADQHYITNSELLLDSWEKALGLPDHIFTAPRTSLDRATRVRDILIRLAKCHITTEEDYVTLCTELGFNVDVLPGSEIGILEAGFPFYLFPTATDARFYCFVKFFGEDLPPLFPYDIPFIVGTELPNLAMRLLDSLKPVNVRLIYSFELFDRDALVDEGKRFYLTYEDGQLIGL